MGVFQKNKKKSKIENNKFSKNALLIFFFLTDDFRKKIPPSAFLVDKRASGTLTGKATSYGCFYQLTGVPVN